MTASDDPKQLVDLISRWASGDESVRDALFQSLAPLMMSLARQQLNRSGRQLSLESRDLANEASIRLLKLMNRPDSQPHLVRLVAKMIRATCVDLARERGAAKRRGQQVSLSMAGPAGDAPLDLLDLDQAIGKLALRDPLAADVTELRFFSGLSESETADVLEVSRATVTRKWKFARLFLRRALD
ncbi:MAG: sigma-70 family RNA polymerase sigma factor [Pseudomonadota bacterium]